MTDSGADGVDFHVVRLAGGSDVTIHGEKLSFGSNVGAQRTAGAPYTDYVEKETPDHLILATRYPDAETLVYLDLQIKQVTKIEYLEFDKSGSIKARHTYADGGVAQGK